MTKAHFDAEGFYASLDSQRQSRRLNWKQVAQQAGIGASTLTRIAQGKRPDVDSLAALLAWSGLKAEQFVVSDERAAVRPDPLAQITACLRADPRLKPDAAAAIEAVLKAAYEKLRSRDGEDAFLDAIITGVGWTQSRLNAGGRVEINRADPREAAER